ncbi:hypothetical protein Slin14017_G081920 [Septoria linicola]|nr:hypothetical protein Slin14017_G081920 [Septoria linicola]
MADIQQWRRKIQPARSRTPATPCVDNEEPDDCLTSTTPKRRLKPKLSSYFGHNPKASLQDGHPSAAELPAWPPDQFYPDPKPEEVMDMMMCTIMAAPYQALESRHNSSLMLIFESYLNLMDDKTAMQKLLENEAAANQALIAKLNLAEKDWADEKQDYKDEVKRLEVLLAEASKRGLAEVTLARQDSKLHNRASLPKKETIFEVLEKSMLYNDKTWSNQRATMKPMLQASNDQDRRASQQLVQKKSMTHLHADLPFGTPPKDDTQFSLTNASLLEEEQGERPGRKRAETSSTIPSTSEDTFSTFSCELAQSPERTVRLPQKYSAVPGMDDYASIEKIAEMLAHRRNIDPSLVMPQLLHMFNAHSHEGQYAARSPTAITTYAPWPKRVSSTISPADMTTPKHRTVMSKASGFFQKLLDTSTNGQATRRFSFEPGDDIAGPNTPAQGVSSHGKDRVLRKSASAYILRGPDMITPARSLSPVAQSPTISTPAEAKVGPISRIPTPVFKSGSLARPRQEREDSAASLLTVIQNNDNWRRSASISSQSSPSSSRVNLARAAQEALFVGSPIPQPPHDSNPLLEHTNSLRGPNSVNASARAESGQAATSPSVYFKRPSSQYSGDSQAPYPASSVENLRPST